MIRRNYVTSTPYVHPERKSLKMEDSVDAGRLKWLTGGHWDTAPLMENQDVSGAKQGHT